MSPKPSKLQIEIFTFPVIVVDRNVFLKKKKKKKNPSKLLSLSHQFQEEELRKDEVVTSASLTILAPQGSIFFSFTDFIFMKLNHL